MVDSYNHTGYAQVLEEWDTTSTPTLIKTYTVGDDVITQATSTSTEHLLYDGHGSTRQTVDNSQAVTDSFSYDAYGVLLGNPASTTTNLLYTGEMYDSQSDSYYLRARYYFPGTGTFNRLDPFPGNNQDPQSLHKYLYCHADPVNAIDPSGLMTKMEILFVAGIVANLLAIYLDVRWLSSSIREGNHFQTVLAELWLGLDVILLMIPFAGGGARLAFAGASICISVVEVSLLRIAIALYRAGATFGDYNVAPHGEQPSPRPGGTEAHHGMLDKWMKENVKGYNSRKAPSVVVPKSAHGKTKALFNNWRKLMRNRIGGRFDWKRISYSEIKKLSEQMLNVAEIKPEVQKEFWEQFDTYYRSLKGTK